MGSNNPPMNDAAWPPDCFTPVMTPRRPSSMWREISLLVAGFPAAWDIAATTAAATRIQYATASPITANARPPNRNVAIRPLRPPIRSTIRPARGESSAARTMLTVARNPSCSLVIERSSMMLAPTMLSAEVEKAAAAIAVNSNAPKLLIFGAAALGPESDLVRGPPFGLAAAIRRVAPRSSSRPGQGRCLAPRRRWEPQRRRGRRHDLESSWPRRAQRPSARD